MGIQIMSHMDTMEWSKKRHILDILVENVR